MIKPPADEGFAEKCAILFPSSNMGSMSEGSSWAGGVAAVELGWYRVCRAARPWSLGWTLTDSLPSKLAWPRTREARARYSEVGLWQQTSRHSIFHIYT